VNVISVHNKKKLDEFRFKAGSPHKNKKKELNADLEQEFRKTKKRTTNSIHIFFGFQKFRKI